MRKSERADSFQPYRVFETGRFLSDLASLGQVAQRGLLAATKSRFFASLRSAQNDMSS